MSGEASNHPEENDLHTSYTISTMKFTAISITLLSLLLMGLASPTPLQSLSNAIVARGSDEIGGPGSHCPIDPVTHGCETS
ncbi:hypothetical protein BJ165DRAFT_1610801 [Panaeolus papilionaceus]|nr:hypothetical protein BJ165DRAFT_1610801 [Panaeolus papilionaceus]